MSLSKENTNTMLSKIIVDAKSLPTLSKISALRKCWALKTDIQQLIDLTECQALQVQKQADQKVEELISAENQINTKLQERKSKETELKSLEQTLAVLREKLRILDDDIRKMNSEIASLNRKIEEEETKRTDALTDLIPGVGFIGGLITGRYERMIPFYSTVEGVASLITRDKENAERRVRQTQSEKNDLNQQLDTNENTKKQNYNRKVEMEKEIEILRKDIAKKEVQKKIIGKKLTSLKNNVLKLKGVVQQQILIQGFVKTIKFLIFEDAFDEKEAEDLVQQLKNIQHASRAITLD